MPSAAPRRFPVTFARLSLVALAALLSVAPARAADALGEHARSRIAPAPFAPLAAVRVPVVFGANVIVNPGAEDSLASPDSSTPVSVPGWTSSGPATSIRWATTSGSFPALPDRGPVVRGTNLFSGGANNAASRLAQTIDVSALATHVDQGIVSFRLAGYLGGFASQGDNARVSVRFTTAGGATLDSTVIGPVTASDRTGLTSLLHRSATGTVPALTRRLVVTQWFTRSEGAYDDGYADSLGFQMDLPVSAGVAAAGANPLRLAVAPNPVRGEAAIAFTLARDGDARVDVLDLAGRRVATLADGAMRAGEHALRWDGAGVRPGVYLVRLACADGVRVQRVVRLRP